MKLIFACPTYGPLYPQVYHTHLAAVMHAANHAGVKWTGSANVDRLGHDASRNQIAKSCLSTPKPQADAIFWVDSDIVLPADAITRLVVSDGIARQCSTDLSYLASHAFITGMYYQRTGKENFPVVGVLNEAEIALKWMTGWQDESIAAVDGCGFGCLLTGIELFRKIEYPWFTHNQPVKGRGSTRWSEDLGFCLRAKDAGFQLYCDTGVQCGHLGDPQVVTREDYEEAKNAKELAKQNDYRGGSTAHERTS